ncbi:hypothetical protein V7S43_004148 [Phytophthora oleae]|uniref:M96 mating-specific protein family n=1 Tax=Phytophthora oleae TaxID=2107226 RepID=A0ABD3FW42_9STRA
MDILVAEDDSLVSLEEALAFIDGCEISDNSFTQALVGGSPVDFFTPSELLPAKPVDLKVPVSPAPKKRVKPQRKLSESSSSQDDKATKRRRVRSAASSSTRLQQRKRAELQALREQAQELETQVELLKRNKFLPGDVALEPVDDKSLKKNPANWHDAAIEQYKERLVSEKTNRRLKSILGNQERVNGALNTLLQKRSVLNGMDYVLSLQSGVGNLLSEASENEPVVDKRQHILKELEELVQCIYKRYKARFTATTQAPAISCDMRVKHDDKRGKMIEFVTTTPMACSTDEATKILWKELTTYRDYPGKTYKYMKGTKPNTHEKNFVMSVKSPSGVIELNGLQFMQKFEDLDRTVFIVAEHMFLPTKGLHFRDECWMTVTPSESGQSASVVEIFLQLYMERDDGLQVSSEDVAYAQNIVMGSLSNTFRKFFQAQQNALMEKAGRVTLPSASIPSIIV